MIQTAFEQLVNNFVKIDVFVSNAGYMSNIALIVTSDAEDWWEGFETNIKGSFNSIRAFLPHAAANAIVLSVNAGLATNPSNPGLSSYSSSKIASAKLFEHLQVEHPELRVINIHPGVVGTTMTEKTRMPANNNPELVGGVTVWLSSHEANFLSGKFIWANWDVEELKDRAAEIKGSRLLELDLNQ